jgi:hypothetical protein
MKFMASTLKLTMRGVRISGDIGMEAIYFAHEKGMYF